MLRTIIGRSFLWRAASHKSMKTSKHLIGLNCWRGISDSSAYDGDGKTTVRVLNKDEPNINMVNTYSARGFRLSNNLYVSGSIILFPTHVYSWNIKRGIDINLESLLLFDLIVPKVKIIIIGYGSRDEPYDSSLVLSLKKKGISCEILPTPNAVTTYNYLVCDSVHVAGAFVPVRDHVNMHPRDHRALNEMDYMLETREWLPDRSREDPRILFEERKKDYKKDTKKTFDDI